MLIMENGYQNKEMFTRHNQNNITLETYGFLLMVSHVAHINMEVY